MPAPRSSRRMAARGAKAAPAPSTEAIDVDAPVAGTDEYAAQTAEFGSTAAPTDDFGTTEPAVDDFGTSAEPAPAAEDLESDAPAPSRSGRKASSKSSRRSGRAKSSASGSASARSEAARELTPEEQAARKAALAFALKSLIGVVVGLMVAVALWWFVLRVPENVLTARRVLAEARSLADSCEKAVALKDPTSANEKREQALSALQIAELGFAKANPDQNDPKFAGVELAAQAAALADRLSTELSERVARVERDRHVERNIAKLMSGFGRLTGNNAFSDAELATFEREVQDFLDNPVIPGAGRNEQYVTKDYAGEIMQVKGQVIHIDQEKLRRDSAITDVPVREARGKTAILVKQEQFQDALAVIDQLQHQYETADFTGVRQFVRDAARSSWETAHAAADEDYTTYRAAGTTKEMAMRSLVTARERMQRVIDHYGMPEYVDQAKAALEQYRER
jgi:hypothetical protein